MALMKFREENHVKRVGVRPAHDGTQVLASDQAQNGQKTIYTVPAGKVFYLCSWGLGYQLIVAGRGILRVVNDVPATVASLIYDVFTAPIEAKTTMGTAWPPIEMSAGWSIVVISNAAGLLVDGWCFGWIE